MQKGCPKCGRMVNPSLDTCPYCGYNFQEINQVFNKFADTKFIEDEKYAGFVRRMIAGTFDLFFTILLSAVILSAIHQWLFKITKENIWVFAIIFVIVYLIYNCIMEMINWHGTLGKHIVGIEVVDESENTLTFKKSFMRNVSKVLNIITLGIGFIMCALPPRKQSLNDKIAHTCVINNIKMNDNEDLNYANPLIRLFAFIVDILIIMLIIYAIYWLSNFTIEKLTNTAPEVLNVALSTRVIVYFLVGIFYFPISETRTGSTFGKSIFKIKVTNTNGEIISFVRSFLRQFLIVIDILSLGFLMALITKKKQTVKDLATQTIVINR